MHGTATEMSWGCVKVECKSARKLAGGQIGFAVASCLQDDIRCRPGIIIPQKKESLPFVYLLLF